MTDWYTLVNSAIIIIRSQISPKRDIRRDLKAKLFLGNNLKHKFIRPDMYFILSKSDYKLKNSPNHFSKTINGRK